MNFSRVKCLYGTMKRLLLNYGKSHSDMGGYCPEKLDKEKIQVIILKNRKEVRKFLHRL